MRDLCEFAASFSMRTDFGAFDAVVARFAPEAPRQRVFVKQVKVGSGRTCVDTFLKFYRHQHHPWQYWLRPSKACCEFTNYQELKRLGVPAAEPIAWGEKRDWLGRLHSAFIFTQEVPNSVTLIDFFRENPSREDRAAVRRQLSDIVARLHAAKFFYYDLVWRNILVSRPPGGALRVVLIDCPRGGLARFGHSRRRLRDLASLDKWASRLCSRVERLRFLLEYLGPEAGRAKVRKLARACVAYRARRWPEDWNGK
jgi:tRNA A-37 threonylcarbamoyl transferase component Bud32